jgi:outer membrane lipopolysaccharide assembly protein LptE/RlpB
VTRARSWTALVPVVAALACAACGYALVGRGAGSLPAHVKRIGVPAFQNRSTTPDLDRVLTEAVRDEFRSRGRYEIVADSTGVDALLTVIIQSATQEPAGFTATSQASRYVVTVSASTEFKIANDSKPPETPRILVTDEYEVAGGAGVVDLATLFAQDRNVLQRLARTFATQLVSRILDNF